MQAPILSLSNVSRRYKKTDTLKEVTVEIPPSEITGIVGPDGSGKSTLLKICAGVLSYEGTALFRDEDIRRNPERIKEHMSFMPQGIGLNLYMDLSIDENIDFFAAVKNVPIREKNRLKDHLLAATGLIRFRDRFARHLSGGMKQKLGICCSLISRPDLLLLDEPSTGVDPLSRRQLWEILNTFIRENRTTLLLATSYMDEAERCHSIRFLQNGKILFSGDPEQLMTDGRDLEDAFFEILLRGRELPSYDIPFPRRDSNGAREAIVISGTSKSFGSFKAVDAINLSIEQGEIFGFLGPNGAGKTTLLKCMLALLTPEEGSITILGLPAGHRELKKKIGYMSQIFSLYGDLTVEENIALYGSLYGIKGDEFRARRDWIKTVSDFSGREGTIVSKLPLGMKQRLALGCAALHLPPILILDEPTSGVDPVARRSFWNLIRGLSEKLGITVIVTTHNLVEADFCDRIAIMNEGRLIAVDTPRNLREHFINDSGDVYEIFPETELDREIFASRGASISAFGRRYRVWGKDISESEIRKTLSHHKVPCRHIRKISPPMEDVFISFLGKGS